MYSRVFDRTLYLIGHYAGAVIFQVTMHTARATRAPRSVFPFQCCFVDLPYPSSLRPSGFVFVIQIALQSFCFECHFVVSVPSLFPKRAFKQPPFLLAEPSVRIFFLTCCNHFLIVADTVSQRHQEVPVQETRSSPNRTDAANNSVPVAQVYEEDGNYW